jgi:OFA family oxalate/formate antiporter-like MFS transporter
MKSNNGKMMRSIVGCLLVQLCVGILYLWSVLKGSAIAFYGWEGGAANLVASVMLFCFCFGNLVGGILNDRIGPKTVSILGCCLFGGGILLASFIPANSSVWLFYLTYCLIAGMGSGFAYGSAISCLQKWLPHKRGLASGLACSAFGLSTVIFSPVFSTLLGVMSLSATLRTLAIVFLVVGLLACTLISLPDQTYLDSLNLPASAVSGDNSKTLGQAMRTAPFWLLFLSIFFINGTWNMLTPLIKGLGVERGLPESLAVLTVSLTGLTNAIGRLGMATISDKIGRANALYFLGALTIVCALCLIFAPSYLYMIIVLITAFAYGGPSAVNPAFSTDFFGPKYSGSNYGVIMLALGFSSIVFNSISNNLYAATGAYTMTFIVGALTAVAAIICTAIIVQFQKKLVK